MVDDLIVSLLVVVPPLLGFLYSIKETVLLYNVKLDGHPDRLLQSADAKKSLDLMIEISKYIADGAITFLVKEYQYMCVYVLVFGGLLFFIEGLGTVIAFVLGSFASMISGYIGMKIAVYTNVRTAARIIEERVDR
jgi:inorganic pyrophosphatase